jgi:hypothetical protein
MPKRVKPSRRKGSSEYDAPQKLWKRHSVDKNLRSPWLLALNSLQMFELISICEGHWDSNMKEMCTPHVNVRWKERDIAPYLWHDLADGLEDEFLTGTFKIEAELAARVDPYVRKYRLCETDATIRFTSRRPLAYEGMGEDKVEWFEELIKRIKSLDRKLYSSWKSLEAAVQ